jgi:dihydrofolate reductase
MGRMRKIILLTFISLDGVMQAPGGPEEDATDGFAYGGWTFPYFDEFMESIMGEQMEPPFELLLGRKTYDIFAAHWPHQTNPVAMMLNDAKKYVVSKGSPQLGWKNSMLVTGDVVARLQELKQQDGPVLQVHGSSELIQTLLEHDLVDELWLKIFPVTLGTGKRLFGVGTIPAAFTLLESKVSPSGVVVASYKRSGQLKIGSFV